MKNEEKMKRAVLLQEAIKSEPGIRKGQEIILKLCIFLLSAKAFFSIVETFFVLQRGISITACVPNYIMLGVSALFAYGMYIAGFKPVAYLAILGGVSSIFRLFQNNIIANIQVGDGYYKLYVFSLIAVLLIQIITMSIIVLHSDCKKYFEESTKINKIMTEKRY